MATEIAGAQVSLELDLGGAPFILDRDELDRLDSVLTPLDSALSDVTCQVLNGTWQWGAPYSNGILTDVETGQATIVLLDPDRLLDPLNAESPATGRIGNAGRILVDGAPAFTGQIVNIVHEAADQTTTIQLADPLAELHQQSVSIVWPKASTHVQADLLFDQIGWPDEERLILGATTTTRKADAFVGTAFDAFARLRDAELGDFWADRQGRLVFRARGYPRPETAKATIGCDGIPMETMASELRRIGLINHVLVEMDAGADRERSDFISIAKHGRRSYRGAEKDLLFDNP